MKTRYLMLGLIVAAAGAAHAADKVYKWKDANGIVHFSDSPPPKGQNFDNVKIVGQSAPITTSGDPKPAAAAPADPAAPKTEEERRAERCEEARQRESLLASQQQLMTRRDGKDVPLTGADRDAELAVARTVAQQYCAPPAG